MQIVMLPTSILVPYENNPRHNDDAVAKVAASIAKFGFKVPIVIDANNVIVTGHTRLRAAQQLGLEEIPCIIADDLTAAQSKAFRLADNKVSETATWDMDKLMQEMEELSFDFELSDFGFELSFDLFPEESKKKPVPAGEQEEIPEETEVSTNESGGYFGDERERTADTYNLDVFYEWRADGLYQMPQIRATRHIPDRLIGFNYLLSSKEYEAGIHFYIDDYQFERIWNNPRKYIERMMQFDCTLTPDFSLYLNMPFAMKVWNVYRSRLIGQMMQDAGITVIPTLSWAEPETFSFAFDGIEPGGVVSVSTIGVKRDKEAAAIFRAGMDEAIKRLQPSHVVVYGGENDYDFGDTPTVFFKNEVTEKWRGK